MRTISVSTAFKKDYKRARTNPRHAGDVRALYEDVASFLAADQPLPERYRDHLWSVTGKAIGSAT